MQGRSVILTFFFGGNMQSNKLHNELYKLAIEMHKYNGKGVKHNLDYLLSQASIRNNERNNSVQLSFGDTLQKK
jgi:hypothetical protein